MYSGPLITYAGVGTQACGGIEKYQVHGGTWLPEGGPAFIPLSNEPGLHVVHQPTQRVTSQPNEEHRCVNNLCFSLGVIETLQQL